MFADFPPLVHCGVTRNKIYPPAARFEPKTIWKAVGCMSEERSSNLESRVLIDKTHDSYPDL